MVTGRAVSFFPTPLRQAHKPRQRCVQLREKQAGFHSTQKKGRACHPLLASLHPVNCSVCSLGWMSWLCLDASWSGRPRAWPLPAGEEGRARGLQAYRPQASPLGSLPRLFISEGGST